MRLGDSWRFKGAFPLIAQSPRLVPILDPALRTLPCYLAVMQLERLFLEPFVLVDLLGHDAVIDIQGVMEKMTDSIKPGDDQVPLFACIEPSLKGAEEERKSLKEEGFDIDNEGQEKSEKVLKMSSECVPFGRSTTLSYLV